MRIIGGYLGGRTFTVAKGAQLRPTTDYAKQALFNILENKIDWEQQIVLDLFAGSGGISYEFASRNVQHIDCIELNHKNIINIKQNLQALNIKQVNVLEYDVFKFLRNDHFNQSYSLIFADPPYELKGVEDLPGLICGHPVILSPQGLLILEHSVKHDFSKVPGFIQQRKYGAVVFSFFQK